MVKDLAMGGNRGRARLWCSVRRVNYELPSVTPGAYHKLMLEMLDSI